MATATHSVLSFGGHYPQGYITHARPDLQLEHGTAKSEGRASIIHLWPTFAIASTCVGCSTSTPQRLVCKVLRCSTKYATQPSRHQHHPGQAILLVFTVEARNCRFICLKSTNSSSILTGGGPSTHLRTTLSRIVHTGRCTSSAQQMPAKHGIMSFRAERSYSPCHWPVFRGLSRQWAPVKDCTQIR